jgi:hypothetical protein
VGLSDPLALYVRDLIGGECRTRDAENKPDCARNFHNGTGCRIIFSPLTASRKLFSHIEKQ